MIHFEQESDAYYSATLPAETSRLVGTASEGPYIIAYQLLDEVAEWLDEHAPGWEEYDSVSPTGRPILRLILECPEHCVAFQLRWG
jgi:hypothetical protein